MLLIIRKQPEANVLDTVDQVKALIPNLQRWIPAGIDIQVLTDRTTTIRASVHDMQFTLLLAIALVMMVVFVFLRRMTPTLAAGITVPLSLAGTCAAMWALGFSVNNLTLMAFAIAVGFVVDDAIVMIENVYRNIESGMAPMQASLVGARQIGFTVISISVSLIAAFIPVLFMGGVAGRMLREFSVTLVVAIAISVVVSLSVTPMICAHFLKAEKDDKRRPLRPHRRGHTRLDGVGLCAHAARRPAQPGGDAVLAAVRRRADRASLRADPQGHVPGGRHGPHHGIDRSLGRHLVRGDAQAADAGARHHPQRPGGRARRLLDRRLGPAADGGGNNRGRMFINLKPLDERGGLPTNRVINRMRDKLQGINGLEVRMFASRDIRVGARQGNSQYQYTLWDPDIDELNEWAPKVLERMKQIPGIVDVSSDRQAGGLQLDVKIDRDAAARLGVRISDIDSALNNAFSQRQVSTIYAQRNQYRVILEVDPRLQRDPSDLKNIYVPSIGGGPQVPLTAVIRVDGEHRRRWSSIIRGRSRP